MDDMIFFSIKSALVYPDVFRDKVADGWVIPTDFASMNRECDSYKYAMYRKSDSTLWASKDRHEFVLAIAVFLDDGSFVTARHIRYGAVSFEEREP